MRLARFSLSASLLAAFTALGDAPSFAQPQPGRPASSGGTSSGAGPVRLAPGPTGNLGAWLFAGPFRSATHVPKGMRAPAGVDALAAAPPGVVEGSLSPEAGRPGPVRWIVGSAAEGPIDVKRVLGAASGGQAPGGAASGGQTPGGAASGGQAPGSAAWGDVIGYAGGSLHVEKAGRYYLLVGADDGIRVQVDGKVVLTRDEPRPERDDDDFVSLDLTAGDHPILMKLHQRDAGWALHVRLLDADFSRPEGAFLTLPGTTANAARALAGSMASASLERGVQGDGYHPKVIARYAEGLPLGVPLPVRVRLSPVLGKPLSPKAALAGPLGAPLMDIDAGAISPEVGELTVTLPVLRPGEMKLEDRDLVFETTVADHAPVAGARVFFSPRRATREAIAHADRALSALGSSASSPSWVRRGTIESVTYLRDRLESYASRGDTDLEAQAGEAKELDDAATALDRKVDPYAARSGPQRRAYTAPEDGHLEEYGLYVPPEATRGTGRKWPLIVALHGLNGKPMAMLRFVFGFDDPKRDTEWEDRHLPLPPPGLPPLDAIVVTPNGHGNSMYRHAGETDLLHVIDEVMALYPIDLSRVTVTGLSMGGSGSGALALRHPGMFAAAEPLCGYHSYFVRRDFMGKVLRPWERALAEERSNSEWAWNGKEIPLYVVHGTMDLPEANSGVLIARYEELGYSIIHEHPHLRHNVWQTTYENLKGARWLLSKRKNLHPTSIRYRTIRLREDGAAWLHVKELGTPNAWGEVEAQVKGRRAIEVTTKGVAALELDRDEKLLDEDKPITVTIDGIALTFGTNEPLRAHRDGNTWKSGAAEHASAVKQGSVTGPLKDAYNDPLLFVYGASDPSQTEINEEVARAWARVGDLRYPIMSDTEFFAKGEPLANSRALFLVGNAKSNRVVRELEPDFPIRVDGETVVVRDQAPAGSPAAGSPQVFSGAELGAAFIRPNPRRTDRYVVVVEGATALGTLRSLSLPDLLPDFVVYDQKVAPARGQMLLNNGAVLAAGFFRNDWSLPTSLIDPLAKSARPTARNEHDATPYLP